MWARSERHWLAELWCPQDRRGRARGRAADPGPDRLCHRRGIAAAVNRLAAKLVALAHKQHIVVKESISLRMHGF